jgi:hypothetical protein
VTRLVLVENKQRTSSAQSDVPEGVEAKRLLEHHGFHPRRQDAQNGQYEFQCPFHEEPGPLAKGKPTNFYLNAKNSKYYCQAASCGESGNLQTLQQFFGIESDPTVAKRYKSKDNQLREFEAHLTEDKKKFLREEKGLTEATIQKFRLGWRWYDQDEKSKGGCYVIPYLENRRPVAFRFYDPTERGKDDKGKSLYGGPNGSKYWWESSDESIINTNDESVLRLFNPASASGDPEKNQVFICEGELKAMLLDGRGYYAVSIPGTNGFKQEWSRYFNHAKEIYVLMDNDNPEAHKKPIDKCVRCQRAGEEECTGHNPGQDGAVRLVDTFGYRAKNIVLPLPEGERKVDINEYLIRDNNSFSDFERLVWGKNAESPFLMSTLGDIRKDPPPEAVFLVSHGLLPKGGRLLVTGAPKVGKSIFIENLVLSIAAGIPFLRRFEMANDGLLPGHRVGLLDRELSERSLFDRLNALIEERPGYAAAEEKLYIDHKFKLQLDQPNAANNLKNLVMENGLEVLVLDTAYKFFTGDMENAKSVAKAFSSLDEVISETGVSVILTHHHRKGGGQGAKNEAPGPDQVMGSFLWTGWPNGTVLLNFKNRSVADPYTTIASFVAFRDAAAPEPLLLKRDKTSISYKEVTDFSFEELEEAQEKQNSGQQWSGSGHGPRPKLTYDSLADLLLQNVPVIEDEFLHAAAAHFGMKVDNVKIHLLDILDRHPDFVRDGKGNRNEPYTWRYAHDVVEETYDSGLDSDGQLKGQTSIEEMLG